MKPHPITAVSSDGFLLAFVANVPLDHFWYGELKKAGFTQENLRRIAAKDEHVLEQFVMKAFPEMTQVDRFLFITAVKELAIPL